MYVIKKALETKDVDKLFIAVLQEVEKPAALKAISSATRLRRQQDIEAYIDINKIHDKDLEEAIKNWDPVKGLKLLKRQLPILYKRQILEFLETNPKSKLIKKAPTVKEGDQTEETPYQKAYKGRSSIKPKDVIPYPWWG